MEGSRKHQNATTRETLESGVFCVSPFSVIRLFVLYETRVTDRSWPDGRAEEIWIFNFC
jgi:hypothetical protein